MLNAAESIESKLRSINLKVNEADKKTTPVVSIPRKPKEEEYICLLMKFKKAMDSL